jgi:hypothetical protein
MRLTSVLAVFLALTWAAAAAAQGTFSATTYDPNALENTDRKLPADLYPDPAENDATMVGDGSEANERRFRDAERRVALGELCQSPTLLLYIIYVRLNRAKYLI